MKKDAGFTRRRALTAVACGGATMSLASATQVMGAARPSSGWLVPGLPAPIWPLATTSESQVSLNSLLMGRVWAVQLMFTGCNGSCSLQGALFSMLAKRGLRKDMGFLSISIDALGDTPATMSEWLARFGKHPSWLGAVPHAAHVEPLSGFFKGRTGTPGTHTAQVFVFDRQARLRHRSADFPDLTTLDAAIVRAGQAA